MLSVCTLPVPVPGTVVLLAVPSPQTLERPVSR